jgi:hypothetical protein
VGVDKSTIVAAAQIKQNSVKETATIPPENNPGLAKTFEPTINGKRKAEETEPEDRVEKKVCM